MTDLVRAGENIDMFQKRCFDDDANTYKANGSYMYKVLFEKKNIIIQYLFLIEQK